MEEFLKEYFENFRITLEDSRGNPNRASEVILGGCLGRMFGIPGRNLGEIAGKIRGNISGGANFLKEF